jgi:hypothetical protein
MNIRYCLLREIGYFRTFVYLFCRDHSGYSGQR